MSKLENAIRNLTPEQRALLELRLKKKRQQSAPVQHGIVQRPDNSIYPLSAGQRRLLSLEQFTPGTSRYNITEAYRLMGPLDVPALRNSISATLERHEVLRSAYVLEEGTWIQHVLPLPKEPLFVKNLTHLPATKGLSTALSLVRKDLITPFDLEEGHLFRARLIRLAPNDYIFFITMHHLVCDAWSFDLLLKEIAAQYESTINQVQASLPELSIQYSDFAHWQKSWLENESAKKQVAFWKKEFEAGIAPIVLPTDKEQTAARSTEGASKRIILARELLDMLMSMSIEEKLTPFSLFLSAFKSLIFRYSGQQRLAICSPVAGRNRVEVESLIGYFNNLLVISSTVNDSTTYREIAAHISKKAAEAGDNQDIPFEMVAALPAVRRVPLTRTFFTFQDSLSNALHISGLEIDAIELENNSADFDLAIYVEQKGEDVVISAEYKSKLFKEETISSLLANYVQILRTIAESPGITLSDMPAFEMPPGHKSPEEINAGDDAASSQVTEITELEDIRETVVISDESDTDTVINNEEFDDEEQPPAPKSITLTVNGSNQGGDMLPLKADPILPEPMVAPPDDIEQILTRIWERALGISNINIYDNFFDLGGHSLMAVDIFNEIHKYIKDTDLPLAALLEAPTIAQLAERIRSGEEEEWSPLVVVQQGRNSMPLFCIHGAGGNVLLYRDLAIQLGPNQTVYGLQSQGMDGMRPILGRIEDMASLYVRAIRKVHPEGPYLLLGYCMGGTVALEIAQQLRAKGHEVALLAMLETYNWSKAPKETMISKLHYYFEKLKFHLRNYFLLSRTERKLFRAEKAAELQRRRKVWRGKASVKFKPKNLVPQNDKGFNPRALAEVWRVNDEASMTYAPSEYPGRIMHFIPMQEYSFHKHEGLGWEDVAHELESHVLSVYPAGMLIQPFVKELAQALRAEIFSISNRAKEIDAREDARSSGVERPALKE